LFSQYGQEGEPIQPLTTRVFEGLTEGRGAALTYEGRKVGVRVVERLWVGERVKVRDTVPVGDVEKEDTGRAVQLDAPAAEVMPLGQGTHVVLEEAPTAELLVPAGQGVAFP
jgi:hypothetical protein